MREETFDKQQITTPHFFAFQLDDNYYLFNSTNLGIYQISRVLFQVAGLWESHSPTMIVQQLSASYDSDNLKESIQAALKLGLFEGKSISHPDAKMLPPPFLTELYLQICHQCNLRCRYCYADGGHFGGEASMMDEETAIKAVDFFLAQIPPHSTGSIHFDGGEPLLNWKLMQKVANYAAEQAQKMEKQLKFTIGTNGTLINRFNAEVMNTHRFSIGLSIDGDIDAHDACRIFTDSTGSYDTIKKNIETHGHRLKDCQLQGRATITKTNLDVVDVVKHHIRMGFKYIYLEPAITTSEQLKLDSGDYRTILREFTDLADFYSKELIKGASFKLTNFDPYIKRIHFKQHFFYKCEVGRIGAAVTPAGEIYPCYKFVNYKSFKMSDLSDNGETVLSNREQFIANHVDNRPGCNECWARYICGGGCAYRSYLQTNDISRKDSTECSFIRHIIRLAMSIYLKVKMQVPGFWDTYFDQTTPPVEG